MKTEYDPNVIIGESANMNIFSIHKCIFDMKTNVRTKKCCSKCLIHF